MAGKKAIKKLAEVATKFGIKVAGQKLDKPMHFQGVGKGSPSADSKIQIPCAVPCTDKTRLMEFTSPIVGGSGEGLPILYGLDNMERHRAVLEMDPTKKQLTFPGPGGYTIQWSPGTIHIPLQTTPSGHLAFPLDHYQECEQQQTGLKEQTTVLHTDNKTTIKDDHEQLLQKTNNSNNNQRQE